MTRWERIRHEDTSRKKELKKCLHKVAGELHN